MPAECVVPEGRDCGTSLDTVSLTDFHLHVINCCVRCDVDEAIAYNCVGLTVRVARIGHVHCDGDVEYEFAIAAEWLLGRHVDVRMVCV